ncbi:MAG: folate/biopterin family MFS transporter [Candidatus Peregrinibacteria bacterium]|nr:folate/biopterin family MFS transporter [Candidatus Peregrinibacteria bacterium]MCB9808575.1 folate/biopterin family MFS transporter [Candidatus Peribacteria bacterium]
MKPDYTRLLIPFVYFIAGATGIASVATTFYYKDDLSLSPAQVSLLGSIAIIPWSIKPLYGFFSDRKPMWGYRRKPYLFLAGVMGAAGYFSMATWVNSFLTVAIALLLSALGFALADVIVDGIVAEKSRNQEVAGKLQSICRASIMVGALLVAYLSGILVEAIGARNVFFITGALPLLTSTLALIITEEKSTFAAFSFRETWQKLKASISADLLFAVAFVFIWRATPSSGGGLSYYMIDELQFDPEFFGRLALISHGMSIVGVLIFRKFLLSIPLRKLFFWIIIASVLLSLPTIGLVYGWYEYLGVSPQLFSMADTFISAPLSEIAFLPLLVLAARLCPEGIEATMFAILASVMNIGLAVSDMGGAYLLNYFDVHQGNYMHLDKVLWIAILSSFLPMPLIMKLPETNVAAADIA